MGFRPFVYRIATELNLAGHVGNDPTGVFVEVEGSLEAIDGFTSKLRDELPRMARITLLEIHEAEALGETEFVIEKSTYAGEQSVQISPDIATCDDCAREMADSSDRRHGYPFINCTNCGPRYSIVRSVPYDRARTTMASFPMCEDCQREYEDPLDRRFHAQPDACAVCGPRVWYVHPGGRETTDGAIEAAAADIAAGHILAVKGLGGFHLACRADRDDSVRLLRERKGREAKPFAVMAASLRAADELVCLDDVSRVELSSWRRPIVLAVKRDKGNVSELVAPDVAAHGVMLPYTPMHELLFRALREHGVSALVMTSANPTDEPLCSDNEEASDRLAKIADGFLFHDRDIERRVDDSVVVAIAEPEAGIVPLRRSRGYVPEPIETAIEASAPILALGGEMKSTVCIMDKKQAVLSEHLGELSNPKAYRNFVETVERFKNLLSIEPQVVAFDMHPQYQSTAYARKLAMRSTAVQHHHAHLVSCMSENGLSGRVVGVVADGTGYGTDDAIWGCEILLADECDFTRFAHLDYFGLVGGDAAAVDTWRPAAGLLQGTYGDDWPQAARNRLAAVPSERIDIIRKRLSAGAGIRTSSLGRMFDGVASLLGTCLRNRYEAEAAMRLESLCTAESCASSEPLHLPLRASKDGTRVLDFAPAIRRLVDVSSGAADACRLASAFHEGVADALADAAARAARDEDLKRIVLSGGCFANRILLARVCAKTHNYGLDVYYHRSVPTGDGGVSLGQAVCAASRMKKGRL